MIVNFCYQQSYSLAEIVISTGVPNPLEFPQTRALCLGIPTIRVFLGYIDAGLCVKTTFYFWVSGFLVYEHELPKGMFFFFQGLLNSLGHSQTHWRFCRGKLRELLGQAQRPLSD